MTHRRTLLKMIALTGLGIAGRKQSAFAAAPFVSGPLPSVSPETSSLIGSYGIPLTDRKDRNLPALSFRRKEFTRLDQWHKQAHDRLKERLAMPDLGAVPVCHTEKEYEYDGLHIEELKWQLPYGSPTSAILIKPRQTSGRLPAILAFHDHGGNKYFGNRKITRTSDDQHPMMAEHQKLYYDGIAWANEIARRGYVVLVADAFAFASRRVLLKDVPAELRESLSDEQPELPENIKAYNKWAGEHEHIMAKALFCSGTTWPGMFLAEDRIALDILAARHDVDPNRIGCGGLSGGGARTVYMGGYDPRIKCAVCVGFMTTWNDFALNKCSTHTWMTYTPLLPSEMDFPEILGLRVPLPTLVLNDLEDDLYTVPEMKKAAGILSDVYAKAGKADQFKCSFYPGPHKFDRDMQKEAFDWFDRWLK